MLAYALLIINRPHYYKIGFLFYKYKYFATFVISKRMGSLFSSPTATLGADNVKVPSWAGQLTPECAKVY